MIDFLLEILVVQRKCEGQRDKIEQVQVFAGAESPEVVEQAHLVRNLGMVLEVVDRLSIEYRRGHFASVGKAADRLGPHEVDVFHALALMLASLAYPPWPQTPTPTSPSSA